MSCPLHGDRHRWQQKIKARPGYPDPETMTPSTLCMHPRCLLKLVQSKCGAQPWWRELLLSHQQQDFIQFLALFLLLNPSCPIVNATTIGYARSKFLNRKSMGGAAGQGVLPADTELYAEPQELLELEFDGDGEVDIPVGANSFALVHAREIQQAVPEALLLLACGELSVSEAALLLYPDDLAYGMALLGSVEEFIPSWIRAYERVGQ